MTEDRSTIYIAIAGKFGTGKSTLIHFITKSFGIDICKETSFAFRLKQVVAVLTNTTLEQNQTKEGKMIIPTGFTDTLARLQQIVGESLRKEIEDVWVNIVFNDTTIDYNKTKVVIITDCRHKKEAEAIKKRKGFIIRINRNIDLISEECFAGRDPNHISETDLDDYHDFDATIDNNGTLEDLFNSYSMLHKIHHFDELVFNK